MKKGFLIAGALLACGICSFTLPKVERASADEGAAVMTFDGDEIPVVADIEGVTAYSHTSCEAKTTVEGLTGFSGSVLEVYNTSDVGVTLDFSEFEIPTEDILSIDIRYYANKGSNLRITRTKNGSVWYLNEAIPAFKTWNTKTFLADGTGFTNGNFDAFANSDGNFSYFNIAVRSGDYFFIDYIKFTYASETSENEIYKYEPSELPINDSLENVSPYTNTSKSIIDASLAPDGGSGEVEKVEGSSNVGITFDFGDLFKVDDIISIKFKVYCVCVNEFRLIADGSNWLVRYSLTSLGNQWLNIEINSQGQNFVSGKSFDNLKDANGNLRPFNICLRSGTTLYIDYIEFETVNGAIRPAIKRIMDALHMNENTDGQCNTYYDDVRELVLGLNDSLLYEFMTLDRYEAARNRYEAWSLAKGYDPYPSVSSSNKFNISKTINANLLVGISSFVILAFALIAILCRKKKRVN